MVPARAQRVGGPRNIFLSVARPKRETHRGDGLSGKNALAELWRKPDDDPVRPEYILTTRKAGYCLGPA